MEKIDFVVTWVDGNDPAWVEERNRYMPKERNSGNGSSRFRDWELMKYWFRGVEKYAPWVNRIYFVTWGHYPEWLNLEHPKLTVVKHTDFIPEKYLPTFNSNSIELNIHRIPGLSEKFVLFNDDVFLTDCVRQEDFFCNNLPCEAALLGQLSVTSPEDSIFPHTLLNNMAIINKHFSKKDVLCRNWRKFYSPKYGKALIRNMLLTPMRYFSCFNDQHITTSYLKKSFRKVWDAEPELLDAACYNRFRTKDDLMHWLVKEWAYCQGDFYPRRVSFGKKFDIDDAEALQAIRQQKYKVVCVNDNVFGLDFEKVQCMMVEAFESILPEQSSFEIDY